MTRASHQRVCRRCLRTQPETAFPVLASGYRSTVCAGCQGVHPRRQQLPGTIPICPICGIPAPQHWTCARCGCRGHLIPHTRPGCLCDWCLTDVFRYRLKDTLHDRICV